MVVEIYPFSTLVGEQVDRFGSDFVLARLAKANGPVHLACIHLGPGGAIGEHPAVGCQLLCVVDGDGWVSGGDGARRLIGTHEAALWSPGERHAAGTENGLVAIVLEGRL